MTDSGHSQIVMVSMHLPEAIEEYHETQIRIVGLQAESETPISNVEQECYGYECDLG